MGRLKIRLYHHQNGGKKLRNESKMEIFFILSHDTTSVLNEGSIRLALLKTDKHAKDALSFQTFRSITDSENLH